MRILLCARKPLGERCLDLLTSSYKASFELAGIVSNTEARGWWHSRNVATKAETLGIPVFSSDAKNDSGLVTFIERTQPDVLLSVQHPWILSPAVLVAVHGHAFNLHLAPLPQYGGWNGGSHAILNGDDTYGVTLHWISEELDNGDIAYEARFPIEPDEDALSLYEKAQEQGVLLFERLLSDLAGDHIPPRRLINGSSRLYERHELDAYREVPVHGDADLLDRSSRAFHFPPYEPAFLRCRGRKVYLVPERRKTS